MNESQRSLRCCNKNFLVLFLVFLSDCCGCVHFVWKTSVQIVLTAQEVAVKLEKNAWPV